MRNELKRFIPERYNSVTDSDRVYIESIPGDEVIGDDTIRGDLEDEHIEIRCG